jgi:hypothetical protein
MSLIVSASAATSPFDWTNRLLRSPSATAVTTLTMPRTCSVRFAAMTFTVSVRSFHVPPPRAPALPQLASVPTSRARALTERKRVQLIDHGVDRVLELENSPLTSTVILRDRSPRATAVVTSAMLRTCVVRLAAG